MCIVYRQLVTKQRLVVGSSGAEQLNNCSARWQTTSDRQLIVTIQRNKVSYNQQLFNNNNSYFVRLWLAQGFRSNCPRILTRLKHLLHSATEPFRGSLWNCKIHSCAYDRELLQPSATWFMTQRGHMRLFTKVRCIFTLLHCIKSLLS